MSDKALDQVQSVMLKLGDIGKGYQKDAEGLQIQFNGSETERAALVE